MWVSQVGQDVRSDHSVLSYSTLLPTSCCFYLEETLLVNACHTNIPAEFVQLNVQLNGRQNQVPSGDGRSDLPVISTAGDST